MTSYMVCVCIYILYVLCISFRILYTQLQIQSLLDVHTSEMWWFFWHFQLYLIARVRDCEGMKEALDQTNNMDIK